MRTKERFERFSTPEALSDAIRRHYLELGKRAGQNVIKIQSGNKEIRFYWYTGHRSGRGGRLGVKVSAKTWPKRQPVVEALAAQIKATRSCNRRECGRAFQPRGRQKFCSPACATKVRQRRWQEKNGKLPAYIVKEREFEAMSQAAREANFDAKIEKRDGYLQRRARLEQKLGRQFDSHGVRKIMTGKWDLQGAVRGGGS